ncbi:MAG: response regulator, partial [Nitrososphaeraceae archaeon]
MKPIILTVDDDPGALISIKRDLERQYEKRFRIVGSDSGVKALELVQKLKVQNEVLALAIADQRMPLMTGVEFLQHLTNIFPDAKRVLLTNYADTEAIMMSINKVRIDYYLEKPWEPPEVNLYPPLNDLLDDWWACFKPPFEGIKVIGPRWSPKSHEITDFLARNGITFQFLDIEVNTEAHTLLSSLIGSDTAAST